MNNSPLTTAIVAVLAIAALAYIVRSIQPRRMRHDSGKGSLIMLGIVLSILFLGWTMFVK